MNQRAFTISFPVLRAVTLMVLFSAFLFVNADISSAAPGNKHSSAVARKSAVDQAEVRIKQLQTALNITDEQTALWNNLTKVMRENAQDVDAIAKESAEKVKTMNAVEYMRFHSLVTERHLEQTKKFLPPFEALYATMSAEQKKNTDTIFRTGKHGKNRIR